MERHGMHDQVSYLPKAKHASRQNGICTCKHVISCAVRHNLSPV